MENRDKKMTAGQTGKTHEASTSKSHEGAQAGRTHEASTSKSHEGSKSHANKSDYSK